ncbi:MAG TPA: MlaD family protein [Bryobacteraceae bacterium]|nr:MlaD family protein [Bryobacteraceae bacterium]
MPAAHKVGWARLRVGVMAIVALVIVAVLVVLLTSNKKLWASTSVVYTYLDDSAALANGSPVRLNGILAGEVTKVQLSGETGPQRIIRVEMELETEYLRQIPIDSVAAISAENVLGAKFINIKKGQSPTHVQPGGEVKALDTREFEEVVQQSYTLLSSLQGILKRVDAIVGVVEVGKGSIGKLLVDEELYDRLIATVAEFQKITHAMSTPQGTIGKLLYDDAVYNDVRKSMGRVDTLLAGLEQGQGTAGKLLKDDAIYNELRQTVAEVRRITEDINAGKGTAGKLLKDEALHNQLQASLAKVDGILDRINSGQGTIGQLLVNPQLYDTLNGATGEMQQLIRAIRDNPKKYLRIKLALF